MEKQTAVEWLFLMLNNPNNDQVFAKKLLDKAKEIEKEQMKDSFIVALNIVDYTILSTSTINESFEDYYNETFKNK